MIFFNFIVLFLVIDAVLRRFVIAMRNFLLVAW